MPRDARLVMQASALDRQPLSLTNPSGDWIRLASLAADAVRTGWVHIDSAFGAAGQG